MAAPISPNCRARLSRPLVLPGTELVPSRSCATSYDARRDPGPTAACWRWVVKIKTAEHLPGKQVRSIVGFYQICDLAYRAVARFSCM